MTTIREVTFEEVGREWAAFERDDAAASRSGGPGPTIIPSIYETFDWQFTWWKHYGTGEKELCLLGAFDGDGRLVGVAPLFRHQMSIRGKFRILRVLRHVGAREIDYAGFVCPPDKLSHVAPLWFEYLARNYPSHVLYLTDLSRSFAERLSLASAPYGYVRASSDLPCPVADMAGGWDAYWANVGGSTRRHVNLCRNRLRKQGTLSIEVHEQYSPEHADELFGLHYRRWRMNPGDAQLARLEAFERDLMGMLSEKGVYRMMRITHDGRVIAAMFMYDYLGTRHYHKAGYDPEYQRYSPGALLTAETIRDACERGLKRYDFLRGEEEYKAHYATAVTECVKVVFARNRLRGKLFERLIR